MSQIIWPSVKDIRMIIVEELKGTDEKYLCSI
jgi:hypothetical protein